MHIEEQVSLAPYTSIHVGGPARFFVKVTTIDELSDALSFGSDKDLPILILGGGSNMLVSDEGYPGLVIKMDGRKIDVSGDEITAEAGAFTRLVALQAVEHGLSGLESISAIPGTIGGAVRGNAGSFGTEIHDHLVRVQVMHRTNRNWEKEDLPIESMWFAYRDSLFKQDPTYVIWSASFRLKKGDTEAGKKHIADDLRSRLEKQPYDYPSMGSVFRNPSSNKPAGMIIEEAGLKGYAIGGAAVSEKHANFIVNHRGATSENIAQLIDHVKKEVHQHSGIQLEPEIIVVS